MYLEYGMKDGVLTHISKVEKGLKCNCTCPSCGQALIAKKGNIVEHHFAHQGIECAYANETALHMLAKDILTKEKKIRIPAVYVEFGHHDKSMVAESMEVLLDEVMLEKRCGSIVPDVIVKSGKAILAIEIWVTHKIDQEKREKIAEAGISTIEINLSDVARLSSYDEIKEILLKESERKKWTYNRVAEYYKDKWLSICDRKKTIMRGFAVHVDFCPINARVWRGKPYANYLDDCASCEYLVQTEYNRDITDDGEYEDDETIIYCCGRTGIKTLEDLKAYLKRPANSN